MAKVNKELIRQVASELGRRGGLTAARNMTPEQRRERARKASAASASARARKEAAAHA